MQNHVLITRLCDALDGDIFTDAEECAAIVANARAVLAEGRAWLASPQPQATVRIWHGSYDGRNGTLTHVAMSEQAMQDWILGNAGVSRADYDEAFAALDEDSEDGFDEIVNDKIDYSDTFAWDSFDVVVPDNGQADADIARADIARHEAAIAEHGVAGALERALGGDDLEAVVASAEAGFQQQDEDDEITDDTVGSLVRDALVLLDRVTDCIVNSARPQLVTFTTDDGNAWRAAVSKEV